MSRFEFRAGALLPVVCLVVGVLGTGRAWAQDLTEGCARSPESCDFKEERTVLRAELLTGDCQPSRWNELPTQEFPFVEGKLQVGPQAPVNFLNGVCQAHKPKEKDAERELGRLDEGLSELQKGQTQGLMASQRNLASLLEGLLHCRKLTTLQEKYGGELMNNTASRELFCLHRGMAKASFTQVSWPNLEVRYQGVPTRLEDHIEEMSSCYADHLHAGQDAACGIIAAPKNIEGAATKAADEVLTRYFGDATGATSSGPQSAAPLKAMLARKLEMAEASLTESKALIGGIQQKNTLLTRSYQALASQFCPEVGAPCQGPLPSAIARLHQAYERAILAAQDVIGFVDQWANGLFELNGRDVRQPLKDHSKALSETLGRVVKPGAGELPLLEKVRFVKRDLEVLADSAGAERKTVLSMCGVYFCEVRNRSKDLFQRACDQFDPRTGKRLSETNPLCAPQGQQAPAFNLCAAAGFPVDLMTQQRMAPPEVDACMARFHP